MAIDFYFDFISSFGYLARGRLLEIAHRHGETIVYRPADIRQLRLNAGNTGPTNSAIPAKLKYMLEDARRWADLYGIELVGKLGGFDTGVFNRGVYLALGKGEADAYVEHAWNCVWRDGVDPGAPGGEAELESRMGWKSGELRAFADAPETLDRYEKEIAAASARGVFGVPTFMIGDDMWWGNDRLDFLERHLAARAA